MKNVILVTIDTLRRDMLGCYGNRRGLTPFLDSLAPQSILFTRAQAIAPYTQASFPGLLTSSYYLDFDDHGKGKTLSPHRTLISEALKPHGIVTAAFHSNPYLSEIFGWNRGWDVFYDSMEAEVTDEVPYIKGDVLNAKARAWLEDYKRRPERKPFFLWMHYMDIHEPYVPERRYVEKVDPSVALTNAEMYDLFRTVILPRETSRPEAVQTLFTLYQAHVAEVDEYMRAFFDILNDTGVLHDSVVILTADHGEEFGEHGGVSHDGKMFSELLHVPLMIFDPNRKAGATCPAWVSGIDIPPTVVYLFGLAPVANFQGRSLLPIETYAETGCFGEAIGKKGRMKETDKPVYYYQEKNFRVSYREEGHVWALYDLEADPGERDNLFGTSSLTEKMKEKLMPRIARRRKGNNQEERGVVC